MADSGEFREHKLLFLANFENLFEWCKTLSDENKTLRERVTAVETRLKVYAAVGAAIGGGGGALAGAIFGG